MTWEPGDGEMDRLAALSAVDRAVHLVQLVADWEEAWGLKDSQGWVVSEQTQAFPLWPHPQLARACAVETWKGAEPAPLNLEELLSDLLPLLEEDGLRVALFPAAGDPGTILTPAELRERLEAELELGA
jgi:Protein of unknown function (DUF2750)